MVMISSEVGQKIIRILYNQNMWWSTQAVPNTLSKPFKRRDFYFLKDKIFELSGINIPDIQSGILR